MDLYKKINEEDMKKILTGEFESSKNNLRRDISKSVLSKLIKSLKRKKK